MCICRDHPRLRGEHADTAHYIKPIRGSPPPTRGTPLSTFLKSFSLRITPAYAGNTTKPEQLFGLVEDHPRLRGEHAISSGEYVPLVGSPPPTRGTRLTPSSCKYSFRITPAYAGNTCMLVQCYRLNRDHPRLRGEHSNKIP